jgi:citrate lyase subunit alpha/citrate CoA-transferase
MMDKVRTLEQAIRECGLQSGMTVSFHHHLRSGDRVLNMVMAKLAELGYHNLTVNASSLHDGHAPLVQHMESGVVTNIVTAFIGPKVGRAISEGKLPNPVHFCTHGGRPSDLHTGRQHIDVAFIAAPTSDPMGNCTGRIGRSACGALGYAIDEAICADRVIILTDNLVPYPLQEVAIPEIYVDAVVPVESIGDPAGIVSGSTRLPKDPVALRIAAAAAQAIDGSGLLRDGVSFQTGAGGASLAVAAELRQRMRDKKIKGSYALGGITGYLVDMLEEGLFETLLDVQCFDLRAVENLRRDPRHREISASQYASPTAKSCAASNLDVVVLGATEIDTQFNVNVHTDSNGYIIGGSGGHSDVAEEAKLTVVVAPLSRARLPIVVDRVSCVSTPGSSVDLLVTQYGVSVNPARPELADSLHQAGIRTVEIGRQAEQAVKISGRPDRPAHKDRVVAEVYDRHGKLQDKIYQV